MIDANANGVAVGSKSLAKLMRAKNHHCEVIMRTITNRQLLEEKKHMQILEKRLADISYEYKVMQNESKKNELDRFEYFNPGCDLTFERNVFERTSKLFSSDPNDCCYLKLNNAYPIRTSLDGNVVSKTVKHARKILQDLDSKRYTEIIKRNISLKLLKEKDQSQIKNHPNKGTIRQGKLPNIYENELYDNGKANNLKQPPSFKSKPKVSNFSKKFNSFESSMRLMKLEKIILNQKMKVFNDILIKENYVKSLEESLQAKKDSITKEKEVFKKKKTAKSFSNIGVVICEDDHGSDEDMENEISTYSKIMRDMWKIAISKVIIQNKSKKLQVQNDMKDIQNRIKSTQKLHEWKKPTWDDTLTEISQYVNQKKNLEYVKKLTSEKNSKKSCIPMHAQHRARRHSVTYKLQKVLQDQMKQFTKFEEIEHQRLTSVIKEQTE